MLESLLLRPCCHTTMRGARSALALANPRLPAAQTAAAVDDYLRGIGFYVRLYQRASADLGLEEAAAEGAAAAQAAQAATSAQEAVAQE